MISRNIRIVLYSGTDKEKEIAEQITNWRSFMMNVPFGTFEDWVEVLEAENKQNQFSKNDAVRLINSVSLKSFEGGLKVYVIWLPEKMHPSAANAILKTLEEPPGETLFFLVTEDLEMVMPTIRSRTQIVPVSEPDENSGADYLRAPREQ